MNRENRRETSVELLLVLLLLLPVMILFLLPGGGIMYAGVWFWILLLFCSMMIFLLLGTSRKARVEPELQMLSESEQPPLVRELMEVKFAAMQEGISVFRGRLRVAADAAHAKLCQAFPSGTVPLLQVRRGA